MGNMGLDGEAVDEAVLGERGTLVDPGRLSGEREVVRDIPRLESGRREIQPGVAGVGVISRSLSVPYKDSGRRRYPTDDASGELVTDVCEMVKEQAEFSDETDEPVEFGWMLSRVFKRRNRDGKV